MRKLEICCADINSVIAAKQGGAQRVELCTGLEEGGTTPSPALVEAAVATGMPVHVLIRPRGGDFVYSALE
ncbi:MAG: copper homeostasis protein CutC, partial [Muribaculaceae bacterium]|nr:copper homeostasis protein CutC [Muribaculaceae bacterium]